MSQIVSYHCECLKIAKTQIVPEDLSSPYQTTIFRKKYILLLTRAFRFPWMNEQYLNKIKKCVVSYLAVRKVAEQNLNNPKIY